MKCGRVLTVIGVPEITDAEQPQPKFKRMNLLLLLEYVDIFYTTITLTPS